MFWESPTRPWFVVVPAAGDPIAVIPEVGGKLQPLHAVYRKRCASAIESLAAGEKRLTASASAINARKVGEDEIRKLDPQLNSFFNVNTPEDYRRALKLAGLVSP